MTIEKMLTGRRFTHTIGVALVVVGLGTVLTAVAAHWPLQTR